MHARGPCELRSLGELDNSFEGEQGCLIDLLRRSSDRLAIGARVNAEDRDLAPAQADELLEAKQVAALMKVHVATVYRLADSGRLKAMRFGSGEKRRRGFRCWRSVVEAYMRDSEIPATEVA